MKVSITRKDVFINPRPKERYVNRFMSYLVV